MVGLGLGRWDGGPSSPLCLESPTYLLHHYHQNHNHEGPHFIDIKYEGMGWDQGGDLLVAMVKGSRGVEKTVLLVF
ncbi:hypothetical protein PRUPE_6G227900 [Prunus persica]|uniref:Uncharacterized protein n=1 Tax=Prunus persica TaxID=3760 RepID=A0A251NUB9_PRUPE|nr:hypothetical protein PRUPE_6G227900 [Prunus persica]